MLSLVSEPIENYVADHTSDVSDLLQQLEDETYRNDYFSSLYGQVQL